MKPSSEADGFYLDRILELIELAKFEE